MDLSKLRNKSKNSIAELQKKLEEKTSGADTRFWKPTKVKKNGSTISSAVIRLLPIAKVDYDRVEAGEFTEDKASPFVTYRKHHFQGVNGWYVENSLANLGQPCPVYAMDKQAWAKAKATKDDMLKEVLKERLPREQNICNILVVKDPENPSAEGKVWLWDIPKTILKMIKEQTNPTFEGTEPIDIFDADGGCNLVLNLTYESKTIKKGKPPAECPVWTNVKWAAQSPIGDDEMIGRVWSESHSLLEFINPANHKTYAELEKKLQTVMGLDSNNNKTVNSIDKSVASGLETSRPEPEYTTSAEKDLSSYFSDDKFEDDIPF